MTNRMNKIKPTLVAKEASIEFVYSQNEFALYSRNIALVKTLENNKARLANSRPFSRLIGIKPIDAKRLRPY